MFSYQGYGLGIRSTLPLPELVAGEADPQVRVRLGKVDYSIAEAIAANRRFCSAPGEACLFYEDVGAFLVREGREIIIEPLPGVEERVLRLHLLGSVMALLLHQRGLLVLHASAVAIRGEAVAFLGEPRRGKSTTAAAMHLRGYGIVADDAVAVDFGDTGSPIVFPGFPQLKLWPEAITWMGDIPETLPLVHPRFEKRARHITGSFSQIALPLRRLYVLDEGTQQEVEQIRPQEAFVELVRHSHAARLAHLLEATGTASLHFRQCVRLVDRVLVYRLKRKLSLAALPDLVKLVEADLD
jgi:hypothetical protein